MKYLSKPGSKVSIIYTSNLFLLLFGTMYLTVQGLSF